MCIYLIKLHISCFWGTVPATTTSDQVANLPWPGTRRPPCRDGCRRRWSGRRLPKRRCTQSTPQRVSSQIARRQTQTYSKIIMTHLPRYRLRGWLPPLALDTGGGTRGEISENDRESTQSLHFTLNVVAVWHFYTAYLFYLLYLLDWLSYWQRIFDLIWTKSGQKIAHLSKKITFFLTYSRKRQVPGVHDVTSLRWLF